MPRFRLIVWMLLLGSLTAQAGEVQQPAPSMQPALSMQPAPSVQRPLTSVQQPATSEQTDQLLYASQTRKDRIGRMMVPVMINGRGPFRLIVDTGASYSTVSPRLAAALGLQPSEDTPFMVNGITGSARVPSIPIDHLQAGDLHLRDVHLPVIWAPVMADADGILGAAGLKNERILAQFTRNKVTITHSPSGLVPRGYQRVHVDLMENGLMTLVVRVGGVRARAVIDTGAERSLGNQALLDALHHWQDARRAPEYTDVYGTTADIAKGRIGLAPIIMFGPLKMNDVDLIYGDFHIFEVWKMRDEPALILGMDVLGSVTSLGIDFRNRELYFEGAYLGTG